MSNIISFDYLWKNKDLLKILKQERFIDFQSYSIAILAVAKAWYNNWLEQIDIHTYNAQQDLIRISLIIDHNDKFINLLNTIQTHIISNIKLGNEGKGKIQVIYFAGSIFKDINQVNKILFNYLINCHPKGTTGYFNSNIFTKGMNDKFINNIEKIFTKALLHPKLALKEIAKIDNIQWQQIYKLSAPAVYKNLINVPIHTQIIKQIKKYPKKISIVYKDVELTYQELEILSSKIATVVRQNLSKKQSRVGIYLPRSIEFVVSLLGILRAGSSFVSLDTLAPNNRIEFIINNAKLDLILVDKKYEWLSNTKTKIIYIEQIFNSSSFNLLFNDLPVPLNQEAYVMYTSGTSGTPKGVSISHKSLSFYTDIARRKFKIKKSDHILQFSSLNFDAVIEEIFPCLSIGARLVLRGESLSYNMQSFITKINESRITVLDLPTGYWREMLYYLETFNIRLPLHLRLIIIGGETLYSRDAQRWFSVTKNTIVLLNTYGPTETTVVSTMYKVIENNNSNQNPPIGQPIPGSKIIILDQLGQISPLGGIGELCIGGFGVGIGYIGGKTKNGGQNLNKFIKLNYEGKYLGRFYRTGDIGYYLDDGNIQYIGRMDNQVKIRGFRVELNEITSILSNHPDIIDVTAIAIKHEVSTKIIVFVVVKQHVKHCKKEILQYLQLYLPDYLLPKDINFVEKLPKINNGKIDIVLLTSLYSERIRESIKANIELVTNSPTEKTLMELWYEVLSTEALSTEWNFFEHGGNSLTAIRFNTLIRRRLDISLPANQIYITPSIIELAKIIDSYINTSNKTLRGVDYKNKKEPKLLKFQDWRCQESLIELKPTPISNKISLYEENILLTGVTGFLGSRILSSLLKNTKRKIFCLIRADTDVQAKEKIISAFRIYKTIDNHNLDRIIPLRGDMTKQLLGLTPHMYNTISSEVTRIIHCAADTNMLLPYKKGTIVNVIGTKNILKFAISNITKKVEYISTLAIFDCKPSLENVNIETDIDEVKNVTSGYAQSKWICDKMAISAIAQGLDLRIYRCGRIWGDFKNYIGPSNDFIVRFIKGCLTIKAFPDLHIILDILPVDFISNIIIEYANKFTISDSRVLHLSNSNTIFLHDIIDLLHKQGHVFKVINYLSWREILFSQLENTNFITNPLYPFIPIFEADDPNEWIDKWLPCKKTEKILTKISIEYPQIKGLLSINTLF